MFQRDSLLRLLCIIVLILFIGGWVAFFSEANPSLEAKHKTYAQEVSLDQDASSSLEQCTTTSIPVLMYHHTRSCPEGSGCGTKGSVEYGLSVDPTLFEQQMRTLHEKGYHSVLPRELSSGYVPCKSFVLTFDDGYDDNRAVLPILRTYGFHAGFAIIIDRVDRPGYLGASDIVTLLTGGHEILSHSVSHPSLVSLSDTRLQEELVNSKNALESAFGIPVRGLVYPSGKYDVRVEHAAQKAGYQMAFTTVGGWAHLDGDAFAMRRIRMSNTMNADLGDVLK